MSASVSHGRSQQVANRCLQTIAQLIPLSSAVFYRVDARQMPQNYVLHNVAENTHRQYLEHFQSHDPLLPVHFHHQRASVVTMTPVRVARCRHYYHDFMLPNNMRDMTEIFIRRRQGIVAGISLMRDTPFSEEERQRVGAILPLVDLVIGDALQDEEAFSGLLTLKEREILDLVKEGASNKIIARELNISLSTVKTHLRHIFSKTEVVNRTELVSRSRAGA
ncbi:helix-turn-helix transcriptional regulator [Pluralibacter gergoviae]|uniref:LuxR C-terminal-related transcriptional regulator n=1 Tax=Pluralibacter gergoviae TaxID=61647 RepID=A0AAW8HN56_PLUGE|nr:LuxR C-terminal-related transcriptional regulator [Pluralibacter gergoviae]AVR05090.1 DNA-binding response regulator [Pluralibacter gergoviae]EKV0932061.1 response regulator transcription factor [Pluralibacter gergoviae]EKW9964823.1 response regulator transcription factor [Pluralibacter gergoviae]ELD4270005.1 response regulator transcription factor [Pluralibacter gergoviae]ELD4274985.1 response regulator transcription factor [Pluralibacter gergoviae]